MSLLFSDKYKPKITRGVVGAEYAAMGLFAWLRSWDTPRKQFNAVMLSGPPGIGKSLLAELACAETGMLNVLHLDSTRKRTKKAIEEVVEAFGSRKINAYLTGKMQRSRPSAVIVDDLDAMVTGGTDSSGVPQVVSLVKAARVPVICVCNDGNHRSFKTLIALCMHIRCEVLLFLSNANCFHVACSDHRWNK